MLTATLLPVAMILAACSSAASPKALPVAVIDSPGRSGGTYAGFTFPIEVTATDADGFVRSVEFFVNGKSIAVDSNPPFAASHLVLQTGMIEIGAIAVDDEGGKSPMTTERIQVVACPPSIPCAKELVVEECCLPRPAVQWLGPRPSASFVAPASIVLEVQAMTRVGEITRVTFLVDGAPLGTVSTPPFRYQWTEVPSGTFSVTAVAENSFEMTATTLPNTVRVCAKPPK